jgi:hypothetical protein
MSAATSVHNCILLAKESLQIHQDIRHVQTNGTMVAAALLDGLRRRIDVALVASFQCRNTPGGVVLLGFRFDNPAK